MWRSCPRYPGSSRSWLEPLEPGLWDMSHIFLCRAKKDMQTFLMSQKYGRINCISLSSFRKNCCKWDFLEAVPTKFQTFLFSLLGALTSPLSATSIFLKVSSHNSLQSTLFSIVLPYKPVIVYGTQWQGDLDVNTNSMAADHYVWPRGWSKGKGRRWGNSRH